MPRMHNLEWQHSDTHTLRASAYMQFIRQTDAPSALILDKAGGSHPPGGCVSS